MSRRRNRVLGKSPSFMAMNRTRLRALANGGVTQDFSANVENIREISRKLGYNILSDATFVYVPSSYGESKNFAQVQNKRNLLQWSEDYTQSYWIKTNTAISSNTIAAPDGTLTADKLTETTATSNHQAEVNAGIPLVKHTLSVWMKAADRNFGCLVLGVSHAVFFDLQNGIITSTAGTGTTGEIESYPNGWYRCSITATPTNAFARIVTAISGTVNSYTGVAGNGIYIWGAQLEQGAYATPYQKTVAAGDGIVDFNFTRATASRVTNKLGVIEDSCYNLFQQSENFDNAYWVKSGTTITTTTNLNPFGRNKTCLLADTTASATHYMASGSTSVISGVTYTQVIYIKKVTHDWVQILFAATTFSNYWVNFNLTTGVFGNGSMLTRSSEYLGNGWWKLTLTALCTNTVTGNLTAVYSTNNTDGGIYTTLNYTGTGAILFEIAAEQFVIGSTPRPYLKTTNRLNVPKLDYSRGTGEAELLIERASTNLLLQSETFTTTWTLQATTATLNSSLNPFGINKSYYVTDNSTVTAHTFFQNTAITTGTIYTASYYVKKADDTWAQFLMGTIGFGDVWKNFNFDTGLFGNGGTLGTWNAKQMLNGYWLITVTATAIATLSTPSAQIYGTNNVDHPTSKRNYSGTNRKIVDIAAMQVEVGSNATTYIPTTTATVTRNAETSYVDLFNNAVLNSNNFTLFVEGYLYDGTTTNISVGLSSINTTGARANDIGFIDGVKASYTSSSVITSDTTSLSSNTSFKYCIQRSGTSVKFFRNGAQIWTTQTVPVVDYRYLVVNNGGSTFAINKIMLFNRTLADADCVLLVT